jgi:hypothetical protein
MKILCAWCLKEGKPGRMGECPPLDDPAETHAICPEHRQQVEAELEILRKSNAERLEALRKVQEERIEAVRNASDEELDTLRKKVDP